MSCDDIAAERRQIAAAMATANTAVDANRTRNEVAVGVFSLGGILAPALLATESNDAEKSQIAKLYEHRDTLIKLAALKRCPPPAA